MELRNILLFYDISGHGLSFDEYMTDGDVLNIVPEKFHILWAICMGDEDLIGKLPNINPFNETIRRMEIRALKYHLNIKLYFAWSVKRHNMAHNDIIHPMMVNDSPGWTKLLPILNWKKTHIEFIMNAPIEAITKYFGKMTFAQQIVVINRIPLYDLGDFIKTLSVDDVADLIEFYTEIDDGILQELVSVHITMV